MSEPRRLTLRQAREHAGLGREETVFRLRDHGYAVSTKTLERWEKLNKARRSDVERLAVVYGLELRRIRFEPAPARAVAAT